jgi:tripartite ATP-independent transporter DctM subunit
LLSLFVLLIAFGMPIGFCLGISAATVLIFSTNIPTEIICTKMTGSIDAWTWLAIPLFIYLGDIMTLTGITKRLVRFSLGLVGHLKGGLSHVTVVTNILLAGMSGSITADAAAVSSIFSPSMKKAGYPVGYTAAIIAAGAVIGPMIPPSICFILIGGAGNVSILRLWLGGAVPGFFIGVFLIIAGYLIARKKGYRSEEQFTWGQRFKTLPPALPALAIPVLIIGGIRIGMFTATEAGAIAIVYALLVGLVSRDMDFKSLWPSIVKSAKATSKTLYIIATAGFFSWVATILKADAIIMNLIGTHTSPMVFTIIVAIVFLILGCFIEGPPIVLVFIPLLMPVAIKMGIDPIHFGVMFGLVNLIGSITPPMAVTMYMTCSITGATVEEYTREMLPLFIPLLVVVGMIILFPQVSLFLPNLIMGP